MPLDNFSWSLSELIFNGCFPSRVHDQLAGELVKARLMKASKRFDEALDVVDKTLDRLPKYPEALLLKAQILWEGYANYPAAKACLQQVLQMKKMKNEKDETIRRWCEGLLEEMREQKRAQRKKERRDRGE